MDADAPRVRASSKGRILSLAIALVVMSAGGYFLANVQRVPSEKFCTMGLAIGTVHGTQVVSQDQGGPGKDGCDLPDHGEYLDVGPTLGFDCKVRDQHGKVIDSVPSAADGTCRTDG